MQTYETEEQWRARGKLSAGDLYHVPFPKCSRKCAAIEHLGASECDSICPHKAKKAKPSTKWVTPYSKQGCQDLANALVKNHGLEGAKNIARRELHDNRFWASGDRSQLAITQYAIWRNVFDILHPER